MDLFIVSHLLLMSLLFQLTEENAEWKPRTAPEPDTPVHYREFCLRTPDDSRWTSSPSATQLPTKSAHPTKHATQTFEQPSTREGSTQEPELTTQADIQGSGDYIEAVKAPFGLGSGAISRCHCQDKEKKLPSETSEFRSILMLFPSETCKSAEFIGTLMDGREVCVITPSLSAFYMEFLQRWSAPAAGPSINEEPSVTTPAPLDPTTELPTTTQPSVTETNQFHDPNLQTFFPSILESTEIEEGSGDASVETVYDCESCHSMMNLDNIDPKAVQSLSVKMQSFPCPILIYVSLNGDTDLCLDSLQLDFQAILKKLEIPPPHEDYVAQIPKNIIDGCRCKEIEQKHPTEPSTLTSTNVWLPSATCSSTEFIETLMDGRKVCVTAPSLLAYFELLLPQWSKLPGGYKLPDIQFPGGSGITHIDKIVNSGGAAQQIEKMDLPFKVSHDSIAGSILINRAEPLDICISCTPFDLSKLNPKDVRFLQMMVQSPGCPVFIQVSLKNEGFFCVDSSQPWFITVLEELEIQDH